MTRNTQRRVEVACPILDTGLKDRVLGMLEAILRDNTQAWEQFSDGRYVSRYQPGTDLIINSQELFTQEARINASRAASKKNTARNDGRSSFIIRAVRRVKHFFGKIDWGQSSIFDTTPYDY